MPEQEKVMTVTLMRSDLYDSLAYTGAYLQLPASQSEMQDALERARVTGGQPYQVVECFDSQGEYLEFIPENPSLAELNFLAQRISSLGESERLAFASRAAAEKTPDMKKLINITYNLKEIMIIAGLDNDKDLGKFYVDNDMVEELREVPDKALKFLDYEKIGREYREAEQGEFINGSYMLNHNLDFEEVYDGVHLPEQPAAEDYVFKLLVCDGAFYPSDVDECTPLNLPATEDEIARVLDEQNISDFDGCVVYKNESIIPQLNGLFSDYADIEKIRLLADRINELKGQGLMAKYKAVLEFTQCSGLDSALDLAKNLDCFDFHPEMSGAAAYGKLALLKTSGLAPDDLVFKHLEFEKYGHEMMKQDGAATTPYGLVLRNGKELVLEYSQPSREMRQQML